MFHRFKNHITIQHRLKISLIALPTPTVLESFPNMVLSFIRVAMFFLRAKPVSYDGDARASASGTLGEAAIYNVRNQPAPVLYSTHFIAVNTPKKGEIKLAAAEPKDPVELAQLIKSYNCKCARKREYLRHSPPMPSGQQTAAPNFSWTEDHVRERAASADEKEESASRNPWGSQLASQADTRASREWRM